jgi:integrase
MLTDRKIRGAKPARRPYTLFDGGGLYLFITRTGTRSWRFSWRSAGRPRVITLGLYPEISLAKAREEREALRKAIREGRDPGAERQARRMAVTTGHSVTALGRDWFERNKAIWRSNYAKDVRRILEVEIFPVLGSHHVNDITPPVVLGLVRQIEGRGAPTTARRVRQVLSAVFVHAIACGVGQNDPAAIIQKALTKRPTQRQPAIVDLDELCKMMRTLEAQVVYPVTRLAARFLAITAVRSNELRFATWKEFEDLHGEAPVWRIPGERMKTKQEHVVPLSPAAVDVIRAARIMNHYSPFVFANKSILEKPMSHASLSYLLRDAGYQGRHVPHGFRAAFATIMIKRHPRDGDAIEAALAHVMPGVRGRYVRETFLERRRELMNEWARLILGVDAPDAETLLLGKRKSHPSNNVVVLSKRRVTAA